MNTFKKQTNVNNPLQRGGKLLEIRICQANKKLLQAAVISSQNFCRQV